MVDMAALKAENAKRWANAQLTRNSMSVAKSLVAAKDRYQAVESKTGVPWFIIAVIHERESDQNWHASLAQGDPFNKVSVHVPRGRGPFASWEAAAVDALVNCGPYAARNHDWSTGGSLTLLEEYNGLGYAARGRPSPYVWAGTNQYVSGKFVSDGVYSPTMVDSQFGCAGIIKSMMTLDKSINFGPVAIKPTQPATPAVDHETVIQAGIAAPASTLGTLASSILKLLFGRK